VLKRGGEKRRGYGAVLVTLTLTLRQNLDFPLIWEVKRVQGVQEGQRRKGARCCGVTLTV